MPRGGAEAIEAAKSELPPRDASWLLAMSMNATLASGLRIAGMLALAAASGCTTHYIPNTDVEDNSENRGIIAFCEKYRRAVERKDTIELLQMASPRYYEDGGNVDPSDDIDYAGLRDYLSTRFLGVTAIRYEIRYRRIVRENELIHVDYTYTASYRIPGAKGSEWRHKVDENRLNLVHFKETYNIVDGM